jgi:hypothetical protein
VKKTLNFILVLLPFILLPACTGPKMGFDKSIDANQLSNNYLLNIKKGDKLYKGKSITVFGEVWQSYTNKYNEKIIVLMQKDNQAGVKCFLSPSAHQMDRPLKQGEIIKINGICQGFDDHVILKGCVILMN